MSIASAVGTLREVISAGGPRPADYEHIARGLQEIHSSSFDVQETFSKPTGDLLSLNELLAQNWHIFRTTLSLQGFAFVKPHGYAGDYEMIEKIYCQAVSTLPSVERWDRFFHEGDAPKAVRNRSGILSRTVKEFQPRSILSIGCGPSLDLREALEESDSITSLSLVDNDPNALKRSQVNLQQVIKSREIALNPILANAIRARFAGTYDLIWVSGFLDYLNDKAATFLLERVRPLLSPRGRLVVGNFSQENSSRPYMELIGEWFLFHRNAEDMTRIAKASGFDGKAVHCFAEDTGVNLFLSAENA